MAASGNNINQRIVLTGADEVRKHLEEISAAGQKTGNTIRASLQAATSQTAAFGNAAQQSTTGTHSLQFAVTNLSFQLNDVVTGLATGQNAMRIFAQQGGQVFQAFQQGGGLGVVLSAIGTTIAGMVTPFRLAVAGAAALAGGFALIVNHAENAQEAARGFDVILKGIGNTSTVTGKQLETAAESLHDLGISTSEGRTLVSSALQQGVKAPDVQKVIRIGKELNSVLGEGSMEKFISAAGSGGPALQEFATRLHIVSQSAEEVVNAAFGGSTAVSKFAQSINDAIQQTNQALADQARGVARSKEDLARQTKESIADLTRVRGTPEEEIKRSAKKREEDIERDSGRRIEDINRENARKINEIIAARNKEYAAQMEAFNKQITIDAQKALDTGAGTVDAIGRRVLGSFSESQGSLAKSMTALSVAWNGLLDSLSQSTAIKDIAAALDGAVISITKLLGGEFTIEAFGLALAAAVPAIVAFRVAITGLNAVLGPLGLIAVLVGLALAFADWGKVWAGLQAAADGFWTLLKAFGGWLADTFGGLINDWLIQPVKDAIEWFKQLISFAGDVATAIGKIFSGDTGGVFSGGAGAPVQGRAEGGLVRGPGTGTSDSIPVMLSDGEFVTNALATSMNLPLLRAINSMGRAPMPQLSTGRSFAAGGIVSAAAASPARTPVNLHIGGETFPLEADTATAQRVIRFGRKKQLLSAGRLPSTA